jgi:hypothetical protein
VRKRKLVDSRGANTLGLASTVLSKCLGEMQGLVHGAGFVLFVRDGRIDTLEGFSYDEPWPQQVSKFNLKYQREPRDLELDE